MIAAYSIILLALTIFSYNLVDPNITLINSPVWTEFRNYMVYWGYYRRDITSVIYIGLILALFLIHAFFMKYHKHHNPLKIALITAGILIFSYPFLSHDFFNYMFDAKILTYYHENPYLMKALDFPNDPWIRFMHWTHRTYPYGPVFLGITLIPSFLSFGKFILAYGSFKMVFLFSYVVSVYYLNKLNKRCALLFATHPIVLMEGLVNLHNDLIGVAIAVAGVYYLFQKQPWKARILFILSGGIKYMTLSLLVLSRQNKLLQHISLMGVIFVLGWLTIKSEIQPWYFLTLFALIPFYEKLLMKLWPIFLGLLISYYPYIRFGSWSTEQTSLKHNIIWVAAVINLIYMTYFYFEKQKKQMS